MQKDIEKNLHLKYLHLFASKVDILIIVGG